ncbi:MULTISPECIES: serine/threonine-protein kinase [Streptomyces]|uniref:Serine/threonine-protein kinase AfsK n=1 Tax=Streptomyces chartreusis NRRL 3882 TaxID=1079985 RepID=A0A2N9B8F2_STRCX|nr:MULTISPECIES: serine/threonine-protein kinase [Streptomyces]MYS89362.1 protein kinase [Streptomyces sp. SID5464]SOR79609.1 Serine/threonine-protein kinase AfsK [Streptomyces chartreusis NRRL 3882]
MSDAAFTQTGAVPLRPADPVRVGPYVPLGLLGSGGMGRVYLARQGDGTPGLAAVKVIRPEYAEDAPFRRRFEREATVHARVGAPYTPELLGTGFEPDTDLLWMATVYLPGLNLAEAVRECGVLPPEDAWRLVADLGRALGALAATGIVHRDFKPSNVLLTPQGAHVVDFGIAQAVDASAITTTGNRVGTPAFMSPEYLRDGRCDTASDVFCFASTVVHAVTGHAPFGDGTGVDVLHRIASEEPNAEVMAEVRKADPDLAALLTACLSKDPALRPGPGDLVEAASARPRSVSWQEPLGSRILARQQAYEALRDSPLPPPRVQRAVGHPAPAGPGFGPAGPAPVAGVPAAGQPGFGPPEAGGTPVATPAAGTSARRRLAPYAALAAVLTVCAVALTAFLATRPSSAGDTGSAAPTARASRDGHVQTSPPGSDRPDSPSPSRQVPQSEGTTTGTTPSPSGNGAEADTRTTAPAPPPKTTKPRPSATEPPKTPTAPVGPPWLTDCSYYSGTELTRRGDRGQRVVQVQCMLTKRGYDVGGAGLDGQFGKDTAAAVRGFQRDKGLDADGKVGPRTWAALRSST